MCLALNVIHVLTLPPFAPCPRVSQRVISRYKYAGYDETYQYYGMSDDGFFNGMSPCDVGTDCTDCGVKVGSMLLID